MQLMKKIRVAVIGDGINGSVTTFYLKEAFAEGVDITQFGAEQRYPMCSLRSTSVNALRGVRNGVSTLGDQIIASHRCFEDFFQRYPLEGIAKGKYLHFWAQDESERYRKRYESHELCTDIPLGGACHLPQQEGVVDEAFILSPDILLAEIKKTYSADCYRQLEIIDIENKIESVCLMAANGESMSFDVAFLCCGANSKFYRNCIEGHALKRKLDHSKWAQGTYLKAKKSSLNLAQYHWDFSFDFTYQDAHIVFRKETDQVLLGSTTLIVEENEHSFTEHRKAELKAIIQRLEGLFPDLLDTLDSGQWEYETGIRHKAQKRSPYWGEVAPRIFASWGLYKNGMSLPFLIGHDAVQFLSKKFALKKRAS